MEDHASLRKGQTCCKEILYNYGHIWKCWRSVEWLSGSLESLEAFAGVCHDNSQLNGADMRVL